MKSLRRSRSSSGHAAAWISVGTDRPFSCSASSSSGHRPRSWKEAAAAAATADASAGAARTTTVVGRSGRAAECASRGLRSCGADRSRGTCAADKGLHSAPMRARLAPRSSIARWPSGKVKCASGKPRGGNLPKARSVSNLKYVLGEFLAVDATFGAGGAVPGARLWRVHHGGEVVPRQRRSGGHTCTLSDMSQLCNGAHMIPAT